MEDKKYEDEGASEAADKVEAVLAAVSRERLEDFLRRECARDRRLRERLLALGAGSIFTPSSESYAARVSDLIKDYGGRYGYVEYRDTFNLNRAISQILDEAESAIQESRWEVAVAVLKGVSDSSEEILNCGDDSAGELGALVSNCFELWHMLCAHDLPDSVEEELFALAISRFEARNLEGWDWWWEWMTMAISLADSPERQKRVLAALDTVQPDGDDWSSRYHAQTAQTYRLEVMAKCGTPEEQQAFMYEHRDNPAFRQKLLQAAWDGHDLDTVLRLAKEGEARDSDMAGLLSDWRKWEMRVYREREDNENTLMLARYFFFSNGIWGEREYSMDTMYGLMRSLVPESGWGQYVETLLSESGRKRDQYRELYICRQEKMWSRYMAYLREHPDQHSLESAPQEVKDLYRDEFVGLYEKEVLMCFQIANSRDQYRQGVEMLRRLIDYGGEREAMDIKAAQEARRPRRPALIDELSKL